MCRSLADVLSYNRYLYARGDPLKYNDPSGHKTAKPDWWPDWLPFSLDLPDDMTLEDFRQWLTENNIPTAFGAQGGFDAALGFFVGGQGSVEYQFLLNLYSGEITVAYDLVVGKRRIGTPQAALAMHGGYTYFVGAARNASIIGASEYNAVDGAVQAMGKFSANAVVAQAQKYDDANGNGQFDLGQESTTGELIDPVLNRTVDSLAANIAVGAEAVPIPTDAGASGGLVSTHEVGTVNLYDAARSFFGALLRPVANVFR